MANRGQVIKEYLAEQGIPAAQIKQRRRAQRRSKKRLPGGKVSFPVYKPVQKLKDDVDKRIQSGQINLGIECVTTQTKYSTHEGKMIQESFEVNARKIPLLEIRKKLLKKHEDLGIIRQHSDNFYATLTTEEIKLQLTKLHEMIDSEVNVEDLGQKLKSLSRQRLLKVWYDHSEIAGILIY